MGKGSTPRRVSNPETYRGNYERIFARTGRRVVRIAVESELREGDPEHVATIIARIRRTISERKDDSQ